MDLGAWGLCFLDLAFSAMKLGPSDISFGVVGPRGVVR